MQLINLNRFKGPISNTLIYIKAINIRCDLVIV